MAGINNKKPPYYRWLSIFGKWGVWDQKWLRLRSATKNSFGYAVVERSPNHTN
jgi:hypothetical protein